MILKPRKELFYFLGCGSAWNPYMKNTSMILFLNDEMKIIDFDEVSKISFESALKDSGVIKERDISMYLFDFGITAFAELLKYVEFSRIKRIELFITHAHSDHIGGVPALIEYIGFYETEINLSIHVPELSSIENLIKGSSIQTIDFDNIVINQDCTLLVFNNKNSGSLYIQPHPVKHSKIQTFAYDIRYGGYGILYRALYCPDTAEIPMIISNPENCGSFNHIFIDYEYGIKNVHIDYTEIDKYAAIVNEKFESVQFAAIHYPDLNFIRRLTNLDCPIGISRNFISPSLKTIFSKYSYCGDLFRAMINSEK